VLFVLAAALYVGGALGTEMVEAVYVEAHGRGTLAREAICCVEELLEMLGVVVFAYALLDYLRKHVGTVEIGFADLANEVSAATAAPDRPPGHPVEASPADR
jgi:hypothetical protein